MRVLVTGSAGFIGFHLAQRLLALGHEVTGLDSLSAYYSVALKQQRHAMLEQNPHFRPLIGQLEDKAAVAAAVADQPEVVFHLAAQAGVRHSIEQPEDYVDANLTGTANILEAARALRPRHLLLASSSSVYGMTDGSPSRESDNTDHPVSFYAATKKANEAMSHSYARLFDIPTTCLRFFTVYGPWGRPDMALFKFAAAITAGQPIDLYGEGRMRRDFTYVADAVDALVSLMDKRPEAGKPVHEADSVSPFAPWRVLNIASGQPVELRRFITAIETALGKTAEARLLPMQPGDVTDTSASVELLRALTGVLPETDVEDGVARFIAWYRGWATDLRLR